MKAVLVLMSTLLLAQADGVVAVGLALGAAVLARCIGTLLEVASCLGGKCDAEGARHAHLAAVLGLRRHEGFLPMTWPRLSRLMDVSRTPASVRTSQRTER